jgi:hypothetical protein
VESVLEPNQELWSGYTNLYWNQQTTTNPGMTESQKQDAK